MPGDLGETFWAERYRGQPTLWSGMPNRCLAGEAGGLAPGERSSGSRHRLGSGIRLPRAGNGLSAASR